MNSQLYISLLLILASLTGCANATTQDKPLAITPPTETSTTAAVDGKVRSKEEKRLVLDNPSMPQAMTVALALKKANAKVYTAYWCPHCHDQGELFGKEAFAIVAPVECAKDGKNNQAELCKEKAQEFGDNFGFPTWEINGKFYAGVQPLDRLAKIVKP
jgi:glutaredoxin